MKKETYDRKEQNEFLAQLDSCIRAYENADKLFDELEEYCSSIPERMSKVDSERSDYLHIFENYDLNDSARMMLCERLEDISAKRRNLHNINILIGTWQQHKNKINNRCNRPFLRQALKDRLSNLDCDYKFRCLSEEDVNNIVFVSAKKTTGKGRTAGARTLKEEKTALIIEAFDNGMKVKDISAKYEIALSTCYKVINKCRTIKK